VKRAYASEPVLLSASPVTPTLSAAKPAKQEHRKAITGAVALVFMVCLIAAWLVFYNSSKDLIPAQTRSAVSFPLYQPHTLPKGFHLDQDSFKASADVVTFTISYAQGKQLAITEQIRPAQFDFDGFYGQFSNRKAMTTGIGKAVLGSFNDSDLASIITDRTWILLRATSGIDQAQLEALVSGMTY